MSRGKVQGFDIIKPPSLERGGNRGCLVTVVVCGFCLGICKKGNVQPNPKCSGSILNIQPNLDSVSFG